jgi:uncharacterized membrane protein
MNSFWKTVVLVVLGIIAIKLALGLVGSILGFAMNILVPAAILLGVGWLIYNVSSGKSLTGGKRTLP